jgi:glycosyltransferase involved in cell wall biosynthesis
MVNPLVSVIISAYNRPAMLEVALQSVLGQTYTNLEILIQDDSTNALCETLVSTYTDQRIRYTHNSPPLGTVGNLRAGYRKASGVLFSTLNDDDFYLSTYLEKMVTGIMQNENCVLGFCDHYIIDQTGAIGINESDANTKKFGRFDLHDGLISNALFIGLARQSIPGMFAVIRRSSVDLDDFPDEVSSGYDHWLTYLALRNGGMAFYSSERLTSYRVHEGSQTLSFVDDAQRLRSLDYSEFIHKRFLADPRVRVIHGSARHELAQIDLSRGAIAMRKGDRKTALRFFWQSIKRRAGLKAFAGLCVTCLPASLINFVNKRNKRGPSR